MKIVKLFIFDKKIKPTLFVFDFLINFIFSKIENHF